MVRAVILHRKSGGWGSFFPYRDENKVLKPWREAPLREFCFRFGCVGCGSCTANYLVLWRFVLKAWRVFRSAYFIRQLPFTRFMLKADRVVLTDGQVYENVSVIPGDISLCVVSGEETVDITRESIKLVAYSDPKSAWMIRTLAMGLLLDTFEDVQETLIELEMQAEEVQAYIDELHKADSAEVPPPQNTDNPYE